MQYGGKENGMLKEKGMKYKRKMELEIKEKLINIQEKRGLKIIEMEKNSERR